MGRFSGMLFCTDLDGTLYSSAKTISRENLDAIEYFKSQGGLFTFITGRVPLTAASVCRAIRPNAPYGCLNGGGIYDPAQERYLWHALLPDDALLLVREVDCLLPDVGIQFNSASHIYFAKENNAMQGFRDAMHAPPRTCGLDVFPEPMLKVVFAHYDNDRILALADLLSRHPLAHRFDFIRSEHHLYEILPKGVSKGSTLLKMAELFGISPRKTIAVGDYDNDVSMLKTAALSFAVENAVPAAKAAAKHVTVGNDAHAIAKIIHDLNSGLYVL